ncbi:MAG: DNA-binding protein Tfx [Methanocella sp. PtaU1.Bin125]|nr:MAG: DNA-binding protein Tfx [Methanocella sp. PtaU1.Bin125]
MAYKSFLTKRQLAVLRLRQAGMTQEEIARRIKTTRANISLIEKRARENVERSKETIREWNSVISPVRITVKKGTDVMTIPELVFAEADKASIHVKCDSIGLITLIKKEKGNSITNRIVDEPFEIDIANSGDVAVL